MKKLKFGISSWCYPWSIGVTGGSQPAQKMTASNLLKKASIHGVDILQIADNMPLEMLPDSELEQLASEARENHISMEVGTKGVDEDHLRRMLEIARKLESPILRILPALFGKKAHISEVEENVRKVLPDFAESEVILVLENTEAFKADEYLGLMQRVDHSNFRMCIDLANAIGIMEGPEYFLGKLLPFCGNYHFKDIKVTRSRTLMGFSVDGVPAGKGQLDLPWVLEQFEKNDLTPSIIIELWPTPLDTIEMTIELEEQWVRESVAYVKSILR